LGKLVQEGKIKGIGLSEVRAETIRRAVKVHPIVQVEVELSLWSTDILRNGVAETCAELGIPIIAYAPLSRGGLTAAIPTKNSELPVHLRVFARFQDDVLQANLRLTKEVEKLAKRKGCTTPQIAITWVRRLSRRNGLGVIIPIPGAEREEWVVENCKDVKLSEEEMQELDEIVRGMPIVGQRYGGEIEKLNEG
jgi:pyridoxine 4-dehydrogenase